MKVLIQRVSRAKITIDGNVAGSINRGFLLLAGFRENDTEEDLKWMTKKILNLRIFPDTTGNMNRSLSEIDGELLVISQFTLHANVRKGRRPSFVKAASPEFAEMMYNQFVHDLKASGLKTESGIFGAKMQIELVNDGPVTIMVDSQSERGS